MSTGENVGFAYEPQSALTAPSWGRGQPFHVFQYQGHDVIAVPGASRPAALEGVRRFPAYTKKRKVYRAAISGLIRLGAGSLVATDRRQMIAADLPFDIAAWGDELQKKLGQRIPHLILSWPAQPARRRLYIHALDATLQPLCFVKLAFRADHHAQLANEARALTDLRACRLPNVCAPELLARGRFEGASYMVLQPLPTRAKPPKLTQECDVAALISEYRGSPKTLSSAQITALSWWSAYLGKLLPAHRVFHAELLALLPRGAQMCRAHGDLGPANMATDRGQTWIFDWESHHACAPILTDMVGFFQTRAPRVEQLVTRFRPDTAERRLAVMLAIAYRHVCNLPDASSIMAAWSPANFG